jgi:hypothetical protein
VKLVFALLAVVGVAMGGAAARHQRARAASPALPRWTAADARALDLAVERLEERMLVHQARVSFWGELRERHEQVSQVACANLGEHAIAMEGFTVKTRAREADDKRRRLASAAPLPSP